MNQAKITVLHVYKDFHVYNAFFGTLLLLARHNDFEKYNLRLCVFKYQKSPWGDEFERLGGTIIDLGAKRTESPEITLKLLACFKVEQPHIVQTHELKANLYGRLAAKLAHIPIIIGTIWTLKDTAPSPLRRLRDRCLHPFSKILDRQSDKVVTSSNAIRREWDETLASPLYETIYTPCNLDRNLTVPADKPGISMTVMNDKKIRIGLVSRLSEEKGIQYLLQAIPLIAKQFPDFEIYVAGEGGYRKQLESLAETLRAVSYVKFLGHVSDVRAFLQHLDLFVQPSRSESLGVAIMEAMSVGLPVVATNVGGIPEIIEDKVSGILVPPCNPDLLAKSIVSLCCDHETRKRMGANGKKMVAQKFRVSDFVTQTFDLYEALLKKKGLFSSI